MFLYFAWYVLNVVFGMFYIALCMLLYCAWYVLNVVFGMFLNCAWYGFTLCLVCFILRFVYFLYRALYVLY